MSIAANNNITDQIFSLFKLKTRLIFIFWQFSANSISIGESVEECDGNLLEIIFFPPYLYLLDSGVVVLDGEPVATATTHTFGGVLVVRQFVISPHCYITFTRL